MNHECELQAGISNGLVRRKVSIIGSNGQIMKDFGLAFLVRLILLQIQAGEIQTYGTTLLSVPATSMPDLTTLQSFLVLQNIVQAANVRQNLNNEFIATVQGKLGVAAPADASGRTGDTAWPQVRLMQSRAISEQAKAQNKYLRDLHKGTGQERGALRAPANQLCHVEDEVAEHEESQHEPSRHSRC